MQNNFALPVVLPLGPSRWCRFWTIGVHAGAVILVWASSFPWIGKLVLMAILPISYYCILRRYCLLTHPRSVIRLVLNDADEWWLTTADGVCRQVQLHTPCYVHPLLLVLGFSCLEKSARPWHVIITPERTDTDSLRRLRVRLRFPAERQGYIHAE